MMGVPAISGVLLISVWGNPLGVNSSTRLRNHRTRARLLCRAARERLVFHHFSRVQDLAFCALRRIITAFCS
jgi:hypothetical protein